MSSEVMVEVDGVLGDLNLDAGVLAGVAGVELYLLRVVFYQEVNRVEYVLRTGVVGVVG